MGDSNHPLLVAAREIQRLSPDFVIYSRLVKAVVAISWQRTLYRVMKADGQLLKPTGFKDWLRARGLFIECLCPLALDATPRNPYSCRMVESKTSGEVFAFCHFESEDRGCGMRVNLTDISNSTNLFASYAHFPTSRRSSGIVVSMHTVLAMYQEKGQSNVATTPHLEGYISEQTIFYWPGTEQLASTRTFDNGFGVLGMGLGHKLSSRRSYPEIDRPLPKGLGKRRYIEIDEFENESCTLPSPMEAASFPTISTMQQLVGTRKSLAATRVVKKMRPISESLDYIPYKACQPSPSSSYEVAGPSNHLSPAISTSSASDGEATNSTNVASSPPRDIAQGFVRRLLEGDGLTPREYGEFVKMCVNCGHFFLGDKVEAHKVECIERDEELFRL